MVVEEKAIGCQNTCSVGCALLDSVLIRSLHEGTESLNDSVVLVSDVFLLGECRAWHQSCGDHYSGEFIPERLLAPLGLILCISHSPLEMHVARQTNRARFSTRYESANVRAVPVQRQLPSLRRQAEGGAKKGGGSFLKAFSGRDAAKSDCLSTHPCQPAILNALPRPRAAWPWEYTGQLHLNRRNENELPWNSKRSNGWDQRRVSQALDCS